MLNVSWLMDYGRSFFWHGNTGYICRPLIRSIKAAALWASISLENPSRGGSVYAQWAWKGFPRRGVITYLALYMDKVLLENGFLFCFCIFYFPTSSVHLSRRHTHAHKHAQTCTRMFASSLSSVHAVFIPKTPFILFLLSVLAM